LFKALRFVLSRIFNTNNIVMPLKFLIRLILGRDLLSSGIRINAQSMEQLEKLW
jgi:hypothetical protein